MAELQSDTDEILEGFLCPICKTDLKSFHRLKTHFQEQHPEDQDVLKSLKHLFGKATKKILKLDEDSDFLKSNVQYRIESEVQEIGFIKSHTKSFKEFRCTKLEHFAMETNKLIIRLDKLLRGDSALDRKQREQQVVEWLDGSSVKLCPECAKSFNLTRRQHHCRLCGAIMCHNCSAFLLEQTAKFFITGVVSDDLLPSKTLDETNSLRLCLHCMNLLENRKRLQMKRNIRPGICDLYDQLNTNKRKIGSDIELYKNMCASLRAGELTYNLTDTQMLRHSIVKQGEALDLISRKIVAIPLNPDIPRAVALQNSIKRSVSYYIKDYILSLPLLPTNEEILEKRNQYGHDVAELAAPQVSRAPKAIVHSGWSPIAADNKQNNTSDPLILQMNIVRGYIKQAREALRFDEVASLEANLRELNAAFYQNRLENEET